MLCRGHKRFFQGNEVSMDHMDMTCVTSQVRSVWGVWGAGFWVRCSSQPFMPSILVLAGGANRRRADLLCQGHKLVLVRPSAIPLFILPTF